jgi:hypothetical protein
MCRFSDAGMKVYPRAEAAGGRVCRFSDAGMKVYPRAEAAGGRKAPRHEIA